MPSRLFAVVVPVCAIGFAIAVAAAVSLDIPVVTADERLVNGLASRFPVRWLGALI